MAEKKKLFGIPQDDGMPNDDEDVQLLKRYQEGDEGAANILCEKYWRHLYRFFQRRTGNGEDAEDLTQDTFVEVLKGLETLQVRESFRAWLFTIASRVLSRWYNANNLTTLPLDGDREDGDEQMSFIEVLRAPVVTEPEYGVLEQEFRDIRRQFESTLSPKKLAVFRSRCDTPLKFKEIAEKLDIREGTAKARYSRAAADFKSWLEKHYPHIYHEFNKGGE